MANNISLSVSNDSTVVTRSDDNGTTYSVVYNGPSLVGQLNTQGFTSVSALASSPNRFVLVGDKGTATTTDYGVTWTTAPIRKKANSSVIWTGINFLAISRDSPVLVEESTNGLNWTTVASFSDFYNPSIATNRDGVVIVSGNNTNQFGGSLRYYRSTNYGSSWQENDFPTAFVADATSNLSIIYSTTQSLPGFIVPWHNNTESRLYFIRSTDLGVTWTQTFVTTTIWQSYNDVVADSSSNRIVCANNNASGGVLSLNALSGNVFFYSTPFTVARLSLSPSSILATNEGYGASKSTNGGVTWTNVADRPALAMNDNVIALSIILMALDTLSTSNSVSQSFATIRREASAISNSVASAIAIAVKIVVGAVTSYTSSTIAKLISKVCKTTSTSSAIIKWPYQLVLLAKSMSSSFTITKKFWAFLWSIIYATSKWVGVKANTNVSAYSSDGVEWTNKTLPAYGMWSSIAVGSSACIAVASDSASIVWSLDQGLSWTVRTMSSARKWKSIAANNTTFVVIALDSDKCATSVNNGFVWTEYSLPQHSNWTSVTYGNGLFVAVGDSGIAATSPNGITWTARALPDQLQFNSVTWANNQFTAVASGPTNLAAKSADGITWERIYMPSAQNWTAVGPGVGNPNV